MMMITDTAGHIEYVNPRFTEVTESIHLKMPWVRLPACSSRARWPGKCTEQMWRTGLAGNEWRGELHDRKKSGELYWELASISPIRDENGTVTHFIAIKEDISDRKRVEQELVQAREEALKGVSVPRPSSWRT